MRPAPPERPGAAVSAHGALDSWKEIACYLNRDVRTIQRWERDRGLPIHRLPGGDKPAVYALKSELDAWRRQGRNVPVITKHVEPDSPANRAGQPASIAVLPFEDLSSGRTQEYLCDGLADELIHSLSQIAGLRVVARTSAFAFKHKAMDVREIGQSLNAKVLLEGGLQRSGRRLRITVQLINAEDGYHLWSERFEGSLDNIFALEDGIARATARRLRIRLSDEAPVVRPYTTNPEAYRLCLQGRQCYCEMTRAGYLRGIEYYRRAIDQDASCAKAWAGLAECYWDGAEVGCLTAADDLANGRAAAQRAVELDPDLAEARAAMGIYLGVCDFDWVSAEREFQEAVRLSPMAPVVHERYAMFFLQAHRRMDEATRHVRLALEADPLSPRLQSQLSHLFILSREYDKAIEEGRHALALQPHYGAALAMLGMAFAFQGRWQEMIALSAEFPKSSEDNPVLHGGTGWALALAGDTEKARAILSRLKEPGRYGRTPSWSIAWIHQGLGETDEALTWLERAVRERDPKIVFIPSKPFWDSLRGHPRFRDILAGMGLGAIAAG
jgi:adenylate cyclase